MRKSQRSIRNRSEEKWDILKKRNKKRYKEVEKTRQREMNEKKEKARAKKKERKNCISKEGEGFKEERRTT